MAKFEDLLKGYRHFRDEDWKEHRARWERLSSGQSPKVMVIACSDSRVDPATIFNTSPGEIFVVRNVANLVPTFEDDSHRHGVSAALEFAITQLEVEEIVVLGHGGCGGVEAALTRRFEGTKRGEGGFIAHWVDMLDEARDEIVARLGKGDEAIHALELETVRVSIRHLRAFPGVREREADGRLSLHGAYFAIANGRLHVMDDDGSFRAA